MSRTGYIPPTSQKILKRQPPAPKKKKKIRNVADRDFIDVFKAVLEADAGSDSYKDSKESFQRILDYLSRSQLKKLERRINRTAATSLKNEGKAAWMSAAIKKKISKASIREKKVLKRIEKKLNGLAIQEVLRTKSGNVHRLLIDGVWLDVNEMIEHYLHDEQASVDFSLKKGELTPYTKRQRAQGFIKRCINTVI